MSTKRKELPGASPSKPTKRSKRTNGEFEVQKILEMRFNEARQRVEYLIKWRGYNDSDNSWEPVDNLIGCKHMVEEFQQTAINTKMTISNIVKGRSSVDLMFVNDFGQNFPSHRWKVKTTGNGIYEIEFRKSAKPRVSATGSSPSSSSTEIETSGHGTQLDLQTRLKNWEKKINEICKKIGEAPLKVENNIDDCGLPPHQFVYITSVQAGAGVVIPIDPIIGCNCTNKNGSCSSKDKNCCAAEMGVEFAYNANGRLRLDPRRPIYECNTRCTCGDGCSNRIVQKGRKVELCIFRTDKRGWGVKAVSEIKKNTFVTEYIGEVITKKEADDREDNSYMFSLDFDEIPVYTIDARYYGNVSRFINHSCEPNLSVFGVWIDHYESSLPRLAFFSTRDIKADEELTFDYFMSKRDVDNSMRSDISDDEGPSASAPSQSGRGKGRKRVTCCCGSEKCQDYTFMID